MVHVLRIQLLQFLLIAMKVARVCTLYGKNVMSQVLCPCKRLNTLLIVCYLNQELADGWLRTASRLRLQGL